MHVRIIRTNTTDDMRSIQIKYANTICNWLPMIEQLDWQLNWQLNRDHIDHRMGTTVYKPNTGRGTAWTPWLYPPMLPVSSAYWYRLCKAKTEWTGMMEYPFEIDIFMADGYVVDTHEVAIYNRIYNRLWGLTWRIKTKRQ
jgi:hypothetical protein